MLDNDSPPQPNIPQGNGASDPSAESTRQVSASQRQMINLSKAAPRPCRVTRQHLEYWFKRTFPTVAGDMAVDQLFVRTSQKARLSQSEREPNGQIFRQKKKILPALNIFSGAPLPAR
ncbi:hypothetical protein [Pseudomonas sp. E102]|uniref:hypothetical protein n=1 Tax=Pseudomonas sp. E102 TaxID=181579 RepID=UPI004045D26C